MSGLQGMQGAGDGVDDDGQFVVEVVCGSCGHRAGPIGFRKTFHTPMVAGAQAAEKRIQTPKCLVINEK